MREENGDCVWGTSCSRSLSGHRVCAVHTLMAAHAPALLVTPTVERRSRKLIAELRGGVRASAQAVDVRIFGGGGAWTLNIGQS
jgi:hypothetical protein